MESILSCGAATKPPCTAKARSVGQCRFQYTSVPVQKHSKGTLIQDIQIDQESNWQTRLMGQLTVYKKLNAPNYLVIKELVEEIIFQKHVTLNQLLVKCLAETCKYIGINLEYEFASNLKLEKSAIKQPGDWALEISKLKEAQEYINLPSGYEIFDEKRFLNSGVRLKFIKSHLSPYPQSRREEFNAGLSIIDVLMFNNLSHVKNILETDYAIHNQKSLKSEL